MQSQQSDAITLENGQEVLCRQRLKEQYQSIREFTETLTAPLEIEDYVIQAEIFVSPVKWHMAHTSWFFDTFLLKNAVSDYQIYFPEYNHLFNSYYLQTGDPYCRDKRGSLSRPTVQEVMIYRKYIDEQIQSFIESSEEDKFARWAPVIEIGLNHEQQHQELILTDLKYMFALNPLHPVYRETNLPRIEKERPMGWKRFEGGVYESGHDGEGFGYDNEFPRHKTYIQEFELSDRLVTNGEYLEFIKDGGYANSRWWLDKGLETSRNQNWTAPLYWTERDGEWYGFTLGGLKPLQLHEPVCHVSFFEADAFARWSGCRLPGENEWELASDQIELNGNFVESGLHHPAGVEHSQDGMAQIFGDLWEWTRSAYAPYPGYQPLPGALGEYNGKFMCNQYVLRGGSCATSISHIRKTYRNFFYPADRWQFTGIRLARES